MNISTNDIYGIVFKNYPDVLNVQQVSELLGVSTKTVYKQIKDGSLKSIKVGREFRIPKVSIMSYINIFDDTNPEVK